MFIHRILAPLFDADGGTGGAGAPSTAPVAETPPAAPMSIGDIWERDNGAVENPAVENPAVVEPAPAQSVEPVQVPTVDNPPPEKILGKYESQGELIKAFQNIQGSYTKDHQALLEAQKVIDAERTAKADLEARIQTLSQPKPPVVPEITDELAGLDNEAYAQKFYDDPKSFTREIENRAYSRAEKAFNEKLSAIETRLNPVVQRDEEAQNVQLWESSVREFQTANPDMTEFVDGMRQYIGEKGLNNSKNPASVLKDALTHAKGLDATRVKEEASQKIATYEAKLAEYEAKLQTSKDETIKNYLAGVRTNQQDIPPSIIGSSSSNSPAAPQPQARTIRDATRMAADRIFSSR